jgi:Sulfatase
MGWIIKHFVLTAVQTFLAIAVSVIATQLLINLWSRIATSAMTRWALYGSIVLFCAGIFGPTWAQATFSKRHLLGQLYTALPINISWLSGFETESAEKFAAIFREKIQSALSSHRSDLMSARAADDTIIIQGSQLPNVIMIVVESFWPDSLNWMPRLDRWARGGVKFASHYSGSNASHTGWFSLLYSCSALPYDLALNAKVKPQATVTLGRSGYHRTYISSLVHADWRRMGEFLNEQTFDDVIIESANDIPSGDRRVLQRVDQILKNRPNQPQFVAVLLGSTHYPYRYPPDQEIHTPVVSEDTNVLKLNPVKHRDSLLNRYRNAVSFLDHEIATLLNSLDPQKNLIIVTGDHGESLF